MLRKILASACLLAACLGGNVQAAHSVKTYAYSDIHGNIDTLEHAVQKNNQKNIVVINGDLVDGDPYIQGCGCGKHRYDLARVLGVLNRVNRGTPFIFGLGNHEFFGNNPWNVNPVSSVPTVNSSAEFIRELVNRGVIVINSHVKDHLKEGINLGFFESYFSERGGVPHYEEVKNGKEYRWTYGTLYLSYVAYETYQECALEKDKEGKFSEELKRNRIFKGEKGKNEKEIPISKEGWCAHAAQKMAGIIGDTASNEHIGRIVLLCHADSKPEGREWRSVVGGILGNLNTNRHNVFNLIKEGNIQFIVVGGHKHHGDNVGPVNVPLNIQAAGEVVPVNVRFLAPASGVGYIPF